MKKIGQKGPKCFPFTPKENIYSFILRKEISYILLISRTNSFVLKKLVNMISRKKIKSN